MISDCKILRDFSMEIGKMEDEFQLMYFASAIFDGTFDFFKIEWKVSNIERPPFDLKDMMKLIFYEYINKITSTVTLSYNARYNVVQYYFTWLRTKWLDHLRLLQVFPINLPINNEFPYWL